MRKNIYRTLLLMLLSLINESSFAQDLTGAIDSSFQKLQARPPLEKLYLHLDKSTYSSGGTIWFKGYLVSATGHAPMTLSKFIYVELFDKSDSLIYRKKIKEQDGVFSGNIKLASELPDGDYSIRAYSFWMLNSGFDYLFRKTIHIGNFQRSQIQSHIEYKNGADNITTATISFFDNDGKPIDKTRVKCSVKLNGEKTETLNRSTGIDGKISFDFKNVDQSSDNQNIEVSFEESASSYKHKFFLPATDKKDFDIQFFPEGGELIAGDRNQIAFKAIASNGYSTEVSGHIVSNEKDTITSLKSRHLGLGSFYFVPEKNKKYFAVVKNSEGITRQFSLPPVNSQGAALTVTQRDNLLRVSIRAKGDSLQKPFYILAHSCESVLFTQLVEQLQYNIPAKELPGGIIHFVLVDGKMRPVSSRMVFIKKQDFVSVSVHPNKTNYGRKEAVSLSVMLQKKDTLLRTGNFSISVTDDQVVEIDSLADNIQSNLLLTSDLKGHIEDPAFYFLNNEDSTNRYLDLLMLTQGWQRFKIENVLGRKIPDPRYFLELGQTISGKYDKGPLRKGSNTEITAMSLNPLISASTQTDAKGLFVFDKLDFQDSTTFTIQSQRYTNIRKEPAGFMTVDNDTFPSFKHDRFNQEKLNPLYGAYLKNAKERMYFEGNSKVIQLEEFVVTAKDKRKSYIEKYGLSSTVIDEDQIAKKYPVIQTADFIVKTLPGVSLRGEAIWINGQRTPAELSLDGMLIDQNILSSVYSTDIATIVVIKGAEAAFHSQTGGQGGVVLINLKEGRNLHRDVAGVVKCMPLGYQKPVEFYVPKYEVDSIRNLKDPDMRTTIYWNPKIKIDSTGQATVNFYTADPNTTYSFILEGVTSLGEICRVVGKMKRNEE